MSKELREYQQKCIDASIARYNAGIKKQLGVLFTGAGKTLLTIKLLEQYGFKRVLWLCWQEDLINQSGLAFIREKFDNSFYNHVKEVGFVNYVESGGLFALTDFKMGCIKATCFKPDANVVMGSVATVHNRLDRLPPDYFDCIVTDESHLFGSISAMKIINHFTPKLLWGLTATPYRADGMMMGDIFDEIVFEYNLLDGIRDGFACELDGIRVKTNVSLDNVKTTAGELNQKQLQNEVNTLARNQLIVDSYKKYAEGRQAIAFCVDISHAQDLASQFQMNGYNCVAVSSDEERTPDRSENIKRFKDGKIQILTNVSVLTTGFDCPDTGAAIMACPTKSLTRYLQSAGRVARLKSADYVAKFKQQAIIIDIVDNTSRHNLINCWELDKALEPKDRTFTTQEKKDKLEAERRIVKLEHTRDKDERVQLLKIPTIKIWNTANTRKPASAAQLEVLKKWGYDVENINYTHQMVAEIFNQQEASYRSKEEMRKWGYDLSSVNTVTISMHQAAKKEYEQRKQKV